MADVRPEVNENGVALMEPRFVMRSQVDDVISTHEQRWTQTPARDRTVRAILNGDMPKLLPDSFTKIGIDIEAFASDLPDKYLRTYHQMNLTASQEPFLERLPFGDSIDAKTESTKVEQIMQAVMDDKYPWRTTVDLLQNSSVGITITLPKPAGMAQCPPYYEPGTEKTTKKVRARYKVGTEGMEPAKARQSYRKQHSAEVRTVLARNIPVGIEAIGPQGFIPVFGPGYVLDMCVVQRWWTITEVKKQKWIWEGMESHLSPDGPAGQGSSAPTTGGGQVKVVELYAVEEMDEEDDLPGPHPYVAYFVEGQDGKRKKVTKRNADGEMADAVVDLREKYGMSRLPVVLKWGPHWPGQATADLRGMPFPLPFAQSDRAVDAILTGATVALWWSGFPSYFEEPIAGMIPDIKLGSESPGDDEMTLSPLTVTRAKGKMVRAELGGMDAAGYRIIELMKASNIEQGPPSAASGGGGESGFQASLARSFSEDAMNDTKDGLLELYQETASIAFEALSGLAATDKYGGASHRIPIQRITPVPLGGTGQGKREILDLTADLANGVYDLSADYPPTPNLAMGQQWAEWASMENPLVLEDEFRTKIIGDRNPEIFQVRKLVQMVRRSPEYVQQILSIAAQLAGDEDEQKKLKALSQSQEVQAQDGTAWPASMAQGLPPGMPPGMPMEQPAPPGLGQAGLTGGGALPNPAESALAGAMGGPIAAANQAAAAGGVVPPNIPMGG